MILPTCWSITPTTIGSDARTSQTRGVRSVSGVFVAGVRDAVVNNVTGVLVNDREEFEDRWRELAADPTQRADLGAAARERAATFAWQHSTDLLEAVLTGD